MDGLPVGVTWDQTVVVAVDFDGTMTMGDGWPGPTSEMDPEAVRAVGVLGDMGVWRVLWTSREGEALEEALHMCEAHGVRFESVNEGNGRRGTPRKVNADLYVDDRAYGPGIDWDGVIERVSEIIRSRRCSITSRV